METKEALEANGRLPQEAFLAGYATLDELIELLANCELDRAAHPPDDVPIFVTMFGRFWETSRNSADPPGLCGRATFSRDSEVVLNHGDSTSMCVS
jgi:hypothetical protein